MPSTVLCRPGRRLRLVDPLHQRAVEDVVDERRLARPRHAGDGHEQPERELDVDVLEVVLAGALARRAVLPVTARRCSGTGIDRLPERYWPVIDSLFLSRPLHRAGVDDLAAVLAGAGPDVDDVVGDRDGLLVVLDDDHRVAEVAQADRACR